MSLPVFKIADKKTTSQDEAYYKPYLKPIALYFDETYTNIKECKQAYKLNHKRIGIPTNVNNGSWMQTDDGHYLQLCDLKE